MTVPIRLKGKTTKQIVEDLLLRVSLLEVKVKKLEEGIREVKTCT